MMANDNCMDMEEENNDDGKADRAEDLQMDRSDEFQEKAQTQFGGMLTAFLGPFDGAGNKRYLLRNSKIKIENPFPSMEDERPAEPDENLIDKAEKVTISRCLPYVIDEIMGAEQYQHDDVLVKGIKPEEFTLEYVKRTGLTAPLFFDDPPEALGMKMPNPDEFTVDNVLDCIGKDRKIEVVDVHMQKNRRMKLHEFVDYYKTPTEERTELLNVLSLEFTSTKLADIVSAPEFVTNIDWTDHVWPKELFERQKDLLAKSEWAAKHNLSTYPKVKRYCLMSMANCFTDYHIDFGGTTVWYHILKGEKKVFWLIEPTEENLQRYEEWLNKRDGRFFGDCVSKCARVHLKAGNTLIIPSGWIHCVYTPCDSLMFGGNFLHNYSVPMQIRVSHLEQRTKIRNSRIFPHFKQITWCYIAQVIKAATGRVYQKRPPPKAFNTKTKKGKQKRKKTRNGAKMHGNVDYVHVQQHLLEGDADRMKNRDDEEAQDDACCYDEIGNARDGSFTFNPIQLTFGSQAVKEFKRAKHYNQGYLKSLSHFEVSGFRSLVQYARRLLTSKKQHAEVVEGITRPRHLVMELEELVKEICRLNPNNSNCQLTKCTVKDRKLMLMRKRHEFANKVRKKAAEYDADSPSTSQEASTSGLNMASIKKGPGRQQIGTTTWQQQPLNNIVGPPPPAVVRRMTRNGGENEYHFLGTVNCMEELKDVVVEHYCNFGNAQKSPNFSHITMQCQNRRKQDGMCPFSLMAQRNDGGGQIHIYKHSEHNHLVNPKCERKARGVCTSGRRRRTSTNNNSRKGKMKEEKHDQEEDEEDTDTDDEVDSKKMKKYDEVQREGRTIMHVIVD